jgi:catechol 2,3-dioxygenase-like lactoylglutathione lyase family enzyme
MTRSLTPQIESEQHHTILAVSDLDAAVKFYTQKLGFWLAFKWGDPPTMAGMNLGQCVQIFLQQGVPGPQGCSMYFVVGNADELYEFHRAGGVEILTALDDRIYGLRDYSVRDLYGYRLDFGHRLVEQDHH